MAFALIYSLLIVPIFWLASTLLSQFLLIFGLTLAWRAYKTVLVRKIDFLRRRHLKPIEPRQAILITGASSGIGLAVAKHLFKAGYSIIATYYDSADPGLAELKQLAATTGGSTTTTTAKKLFLHQLDVTKADQVASLGEQVYKQLDEHKLKLYALINNAGLGSLQHFAWLQRKTIANLISTNISGALLMTREFLPLLARDNKQQQQQQQGGCVGGGGGGGGRLLFVSSGLGFVPGASYATYGVTKSAHLYFSRCMNLELKQRYGIQSVAIVPHNFIKNTNICSLNVQSNKLAWDELKPIERELYKSEYEQHLELAKSLEQATKELLASSKSQSNPGGALKSNSAAKQRRTASGAIPLGGGAGATALLSIGSTVLNFFGNIIACLQGKNQANSVEESGALECFEDALRLTDPPEQIFAGDVTFQLIIGSLLLSLPNSCLSLLSSSVAPSLYK